MKKIIIKLSTVCFSFFCSLSIFATSEISNYTKYSVNQSIDLSYDIHPDTIEYCVKNYVENIIKKDFLSVEIFLPNNTNKQIIAQYDYSIIKKIDPDLKRKITLIINPQKLTSNNKQLWSITVDFYSLTARTNVKIKRWIIIEDDDIKISPIKVTNNENFSNITIDNNFLQQNNCFIFFNRENVNLLGKKPFLAKLFSQKQNSNSSIIYWLITGWENNTIGFILKKRKIDTKKWHVLNTLPIIPFVNVNRDWSNSGLNAKQSKLLHNQLQKKLYYKNFELISKDFALKRLCRFGFNNNTDKYILKNSKYALILGQGYFDKSFKLNYEYGLFAYDINNKIGAEPITIFQNKKINFNELNCNIEFKLYNNRSNQHDLLNKKITLNWDIDFQKLIKFNIKKYYIYKKTKQTNKWYKIDEINCANNNNQALEKIIKYSYIDKRSNYKENCQYAINSVNHNGDEIFSKKVPYIANKFSAPKEKTVLKNSFKVNGNDVNFYVKLNPINLSKIKNISLTRVFDNCSNNQHGQKNKGISIIDTIKLDKELSFSDKSKKPARGTLRYSLNIEYFNERHQRVEIAYLRSPSKLEKMKKPEDFTVEFIENEKGYDHHFLLKWKHSNVAYEYTIWYIAHSDSWEKYFNENYKKKYKYKKSFTEYIFEKRHPRMFRVRNKDEYKLKLLNPQDDNKIIYYNFYLQVRPKAGKNYSLSEISIIKNFPVKLSK